MQPTIKSGVGENIIDPAGCALKKNKNERIQELDNEIFELKQSVNKLENLIDDLKYDLNK